MPHLANLESALLFTPGRGSYITTQPDGSFAINLTESAERRAETAADLFDPYFHTTALYAGGYPGVAEHWPDEHIPPPGNREADLMALPLEGRLILERWSSEAITEYVKKQSDSNNSIGDILFSMQQGLLDPNDFHTAERHGIDLVCGALHGIRFRTILTKSLDLDPTRIRRAPIHDVYRKPATEFRSKEKGAAGIVREMGAIVVTQRVLRKVRPGNLEDLARAEEEFNAIAVKAAR